MPHGAAPVPGEGAVRTAVLRTAGLRKHFGSVVALAGVSVDFHEGEITALLGENGAGKSTLIKCLTGVHGSDGGTIEVGGRTVSPRSPREAEALGVSTVYQEINLIPHMTVAENICLGREPTNFLGAIRWKQVDRRATAALARLGVKLDVTRELSACSVAEQQLVAIARALDVDARLLILDEPTSSLDRNEVAALFGLLRRLRDQGMAMVVVTHFLDQVEQISDRVVVLRDGLLAGEGATRSLSRAQIVSMMLGREVTPARANAAPPDGVAEALLEARDLTHPGALRGVSVTVGRSEIVGLVGLLGSGRSETARAIFADPPPAGGEVRWKGRRSVARSSRDAIGMGIGMTPEDRKADGVLPNLSVHENIAIALRARRGSGAMSERESRALAQHFVKRLNIKTSGVDAPVSGLSGGNQQKVLLARWLAAKPDLLIVDEPTRGIDIAAKAEVLDELLSLREQGMSVLFISSEIEEVLLACDRVVVLRDGRSIATLARGTMTESTLLAAISESHGT